MLMSIPPTKHYFLEFPYTLQSMIAYKNLTEYSGNSGEKFDCGNVVTTPYAKQAPCSAGWLNETINFSLVLQSKTLYVYIFIL